MIEVLAVVALIVALFAIASVGGYAKEMRTKLNSQNESILKVVSTLEESIKSLDKCGQFVVAQNNLNEANMRFQQSVVSVVEKIIKSQVDTSDMDEIKRQIEGK